MVDQLTTMQEEEGKLFWVGDGDMFNCGGNACGVVKVRQVNVPNTNCIAQYYCRNTSDKKVSVTLKWVNIVGGTGMVSRGTIDPYDEVSFDLQGFYILGPYSTAASYV